MPVPRRPDVAVTFTIDGIRYAIDVPTDMSALRAVRDIARHPEPSYRCESATCGTCEVTVDGERQRLCGIGAPRLNGLVIDTVDSLLHGR